jgi:hypothetical protein
VTDDAVLLEELERAIEKFDSRQDHVAWGRRHRSELAIASKHLPTQYPGTYRICTTGLSAASH